MDEKDCLEHKILELMERRKEQNSALKKIIQAFSSKKGKQKKLIKDEIAKAKWYLIHEIFR